MTNEKIKSVDLPTKSPQGILVRVYFKSVNDALDWLRSLGLIGDNSAEHLVNKWQVDSKKQIDKDARWHRKAIRRWLGR